MKRDCPTNDTTLLTMLRGSKEQRDQAIECIYGSLGWVGQAVAVIQKRGGQYDDVMDAVGDAFEVFIRKVRDGSFQGRSALKSFFIGICYFTWLKNKRPTQRIDWKDDVFNGLEISDFETADRLIMKAELQLVIRQLLAQLGEPCASMLLDAASGFETSEMVEKYETGTADILKKRKYRCMENLRNLIKGKGLLDKLRDHFAEVF